MHSVYKLIDYYSELPEVARDLSKPVLLLWTQVLVAHRSRRYLNFFDIAVLVLASEFSSFFHLAKRYRICKVTQTHSV